MATSFQDFFYALIENAVNDFKKDIPFDVPKKQIKKGMSEEERKTAVKSWRSKMVIIERDKGFKKSAKDFLFSKDLGDLIEVADLNINAKQIQKTLADWDKEREKQRKKHEIEKKKKQLEEGNHVGHGVAEKKN